MSPQPTVILETKSVRVIRHPRDSSLTGMMEGANKLDDIHIETRGQNHMHEEYWHPAVTLSWSNAREHSPLHAAMHQFFNQLDSHVSMAPSKARTKTVETALGLLPITDGGQRRAMLAEALFAVATTLTSEVLVTAGDGLPFDYRADLGMRLTPAVVATLEKMFPAITTSMQPLQLITKLLQAAGEELAK